MKIAQITDIHIAPEGEFPSDVDVRSNFLNILELVKQYDVDRLVLTGDLCYRTADPAIYGWIKAKLDLMDLPYNLIAGNHDDSKILAESFKIENQLTGTELFYTKSYDEHSFFFLDSAIGELSNDQHSWFEAKFTKIPKNKQVFIFIHHPPVFGGVKHMDTKYALTAQSKTKLIETIQQHRGEVHLFCGHFHVDKIIRQQNLTVYITPSCFIQIDPRFEEFKALHLQSGFRLIELMSDGSLHSQVIYLK